MTKEERKGRGRENEWKKEGEETGKNDKREEVKEKKVTKECRRW